MFDPRPSSVLCPVPSPDPASMEVLEPRLMLSATWLDEGASFAWSGFTGQGGVESATFRYALDGQPELRDAPGGKAVTLDGLETWNQPGDPFVPVRSSRLLLPPGTQLASVDVNLGQPTVVATGLALHEAVEPVPVGQSYDGGFHAVGESFPHGEPVLYSTEYIRGYSVAVLDLFPVSYDVTDGAVSYYSDIEVTITTEPIGPAGIAPQRNLASDVERVADLVDNDSALEDYALISAFGEPEAPAETVDYLIITNGTLSPAFTDLADHRASFNGWSTEVVTTDWIAANYDGTRPDGGSDLQTSIRNAVLDYYTNKGTQYVLLGGDNNVVPDRDTYVTCGGETASDMPTDLYYAALDGDWDGDASEAADGVYGESFGSSDYEGDLYPEVHLGRIPVRHASDAQAYVDKVIDYELSPPWDVARKFLLGGKKLGDSYTGDDRPEDVMYDGHVQFQDADHSKVSDAEMWQRRAYRNYVQNDRDWDGLTDTTGDFAGKSWQAETVGILTDTLTSWDTASPGDYAINGPNIEAKFNEGWNFVIFDTHGGTGVWAAEGEYFRTSNATALTGPTHFVYTGACSVGGFDKGDALSEGFLRNADGGALVFLGSARFNWYSPDSPPASDYSSGGTGSDYQARWLENIFLDGMDNVGESYDAHMEHYASSSRYNGSKRWVQFGMNLQGDPGLTIYGLAPTVEVATSDAYAAEGGDAASVTFSRYGATGDPLTVYYSRSGSATYGDTADYTTTPVTGATGSVVIPAGESSVTINIDPVDDGDAETDETVTFSITPDAAYDVVGASAEVTLVDNDNLDTPTVALESVDADASEQGPDAGRLRLVRTGSASADVLVNLALSGSAEAGDIAETIGPVVTIPAGQASVELTATPVDDFLVEGHETLTVTVQSGSYQLGAMLEGSIEITDNEPRHRVTLMTPDDQAVENSADTGLFQLWRDGDNSLPLEVEVTIAGSASSGSDYTAITTPITIPAGSDSVDVPVIPLDDPDGEAPETVVLTVVAGAGYYDPWGTVYGTVTIADDDNQPPAVSLAAPLNGHTYESGDEVILSAVATDDVGIDRVEFYDGQTLIGTGSFAGSDTYSLAWTGAIGGHSLFARAFDTDETSTDSDSVSVTGSAIPDGTGTGALIEWWTGIDGSDIGDLTSSPDYPDNPTDYTYVTAPDGLMEFNPDPAMDDYGTRLRGYFLAPKTGEYVFYISSDDSSQLMLSTDDDPAGATVVASVSGYSNYDDWDKYASQQSEPVQLNAGQRYYIEALHKEDGGGDHVQVGVALPGGQMERSIPYHRLDPWLIQEIQTDTDSLNVAENGTASFQVRLNADPGQGVDVTVTRASGDTDLSVQSGDVLTFDSSNWDQWQSVTLSAADDADQLEGSAEFQLTAPDWQSATVTATEVDDDVNYAPSVIIDSPTLETACLVDTVSMLVLESTAGDDGNGPSPLTTSWSVASAPDGATVTFEDPAAEDTVATFSSTGVYVLQVTADDGEFAAIDEVTVRVGCGSGSYLETGGLVVIEAEAYTDAAPGSGAAVDSYWQHDTSYADSSGGEALVAMPNAGVNVQDTDAGPRLDYAIEFTTPGTYYVWVRMLGAGGSDDSVHAGLNGVIASYGGMGMTNSSGNWAWEDEAGSSRVTLSIDSAGVHTFSLWMREDGTAVDKVLLTTDSQTAPSGQGPEAFDLAGNCGPQTAAAAGDLQPTSANLDGTVADDGLPEPAELSYQWVQADGPGTAVFADATAIDTTVTVDAYGRYTFRLQAGDGQITTAGEVSVVLALSGDANFDGTVDVGDLGILAGNWGSSDAAWEQADFDGDGTTDLSDLGILAGNWGASIPADSATLPSSLSPDSPAGSLIAPAHPGRGESASDREWATSGNAIGPARAVGPMAMARPGHASAPQPAHAWSVRPVSRPDRDAPDMDLLTLTPPLTLAL